MAFLTVRVIINRIVRSGSECLMITVYTDGASTGDPDQMGLVSI
jgi:hypothetical protein